MAQRKEELLKELDHALNRKVQEKYFKQNKTQQLQGLTQNDPLDYPKKTSDLEPKTYRSKDNHAKSPINSKKNVEKEAASNVFSKKCQEQTRPLLSTAGLIPERGPSPKIEEKLRQDRQVPNSKDSSQRQILRLKQQIKQLRDENYILSKQLTSLRSSIKSLEKESQALKRQEKEYLSLKEQNYSLLSQIEFLNSKERRAQQESKLAKSDLLIGNLSFEESFKQCMIQLNISFINKEWNEAFVVESLKTICRQLHKLSQQKSKLSAKLNKFDIQAVLAKENNLSFKQQISHLKLQEESYQSEITAFKTKIKQLEEQLSQAMKQRKYFEGKCKEQLKELDSAKKQLRIVMESSKHRKPKRQSSVAKKQKESIVEESTIVNKSLQNFEMQTQTLQTESVVQEEGAETAKLRQEIIELQARILQTESQLNVLQRQLMEHRLHSQKEKGNFTQLQNINHQLKRQLSEAQQQNYHFQEYIKELEMKDDEISRDISNFMPQLKQLEEENQQLKQSNAQKDEDIVKKLQIISSLRADEENLRQQMNTYALNLKKMGFEQQKKVKQIEQLKNKIVNLSSKNNQLQASIIMQESDLKNELSSQVKFLQNQLINKNQQFELKLLKKDQHTQKIGKQFAIREQEYQQELLKAKNITEQIASLNQQLTQTASTMAKEKEKMKEAIQQIMVLNRELTKKQTQYESEYNSIENKLISAQSIHNQLTQNYAQLERNLAISDQEMTAIKAQNEQLRMASDQAVMQATRLQLQNKKMDLNLKSIQQLQDYCQTLNTSLSTKNQELSATISLNQSQINQFQQKILELEQTNKKLSENIAQQQHELDNKHKQLDKIKASAGLLTDQHKWLNNEYERLKTEAELNDKAKTEQLSNQSYDIERLVRDNRDLQGQLAQLSKVRNSKQFQQTQELQKLQVLQQQNKSLALQNQYLREQLQMKDRNKEEDLYIHQLKNKQYCLLIKKILAHTIELDDLGYCNNLEELLEVGSEKVVNRKRTIYEQEAQKQLNERHMEPDPYGLEPAGKEIPKKYHFGTEISSYEELVLLSSRHQQADIIKEQESRAQKIGLRVKSPPSTPRSFIQNLTPRAIPGDPEQRRSQRIITQYISNFPLNDPKDTFTGSK